MTQLDWYIDEGEKDVSAADLMIEALYKLTIVSFDELVKRSGKAEALAAVKPYRKWAAQIYLLQFKERLKLQGSGADALLSIRAFASITTVPQDKMECEICEKGAVGISRDCMFKRASPELCMSISHYHSEFETEAINPEYECIWTHHMTSGDPYCRYVFKKRSDPISVIYDMGETLAVLPKFEVTNDQIRAASLWALGGFLYGNNCALLDLHGEVTTTDIIKGYATSVGQEIGMRLAKQNPELAGSVASVGKLIRAMQNALGQRDKFVIESSNEISNEITDCSQFEKSNSLACVMYEYFFKGMVSAINPDYEFTYDRMIMRGDKDCHWTLKKRVASLPVGSDPPLEILRKMFAKGEISTEEYLEMKVLLGG